MSRNWHAFGAAGNGNDSILCAGATTGAGSACGTIAVHFDGDAHGLSNDVIDAFFITR